MAGSKDKGSDVSRPAPKKKGHPFLFGLIFGLVLGAFLTLWFVRRQPESVARARVMTENKLHEVAVESREKAADLADKVSGKLRDR